SMASTLSSTLLVLDPIGVLSVSSNVAPLGATASRATRGTLLGAPLEVMPPFPVAPEAGAPEAGVWPLVGPAVGPLPAALPCDGFGAGGVVPLDGVDGCDPALAAACADVADSMVRMIDRGIVTLVPSASFRTTASGRAASSSPTTSLPSVRTT